VKAFKHTKCILNRINLGRRINIHCFPSADDKVSSAVDTTGSDLNVSAGGESSAGDVNSDVDCDDEDDMDTYILG
jgi:hypothetical protein